MVNRNAKAQYTRALLTKDQAVESIRNLEQLIEVDIRNAFIEINKYKERIQATRATKNFRKKN